MKPTPQNNSTPRSLHTPGPWKIIQTNGMPKINMVSPPIGGGFIARIGYPPIGSRDANARLIAAAPELLEACKEASKFLRLYGTFFNGRDVMDAAIAKAEEARSVGRGNENQPVALDNPKT